MADYTIVRISEKPPREWSFNDKKTGAAVAMETYKVMLKGIDEPIELNRKAGSPPTENEVLTGTIEETDFGRRFKAEKKPFAPSAFKDNSEIKAEWAIRQSIVLFTNGKYAHFADIEKYAQDLFKMVERVKDTPLDGPGKEVARAAAQAIKKKQISPVDSVLNPGGPDDELINLDDIPF